ncbi:hypothetical protein HJG54_17695 [Leptolyngbya sp. NK1-12]|uniref:vWA-MoxR associated protein N-terminal HTH domain-containing protein n=1 Tax=Leptolyngbya sp. NK1-12 TaxID=2547451 RepID=A0AA96WG69_9CYAN|nr:AAA-like domain-containing protein [Leptolyngbya sp. NK1-12]WNZ24505.1 hypothetical protein HJG54_17695 [Leptolyngbya sp. NK1-12]
MSVDEALKVIEQVLLLRQLNPIERFIFQQSWLGRNYQDMSQDCSYGTTYIKEVGSQLWQDLSKATGEKVTKKNLHLVLRQDKRHLAEFNQETIRKTQGTVDESVAASGAIPAATLAAESNLRASLEFPSGLVPANSPFYVARPPIEELALAEITQPSCALQIRAPRQMGKSSLLTRILAHAAVQGCRPVYIDFQEADNAVFESLDRLLRWLCINVSRKLDLNPALAAYWDESMGSKVSCSVYFEAYLLEQIRAPIVLGLDEVNRIFDYPTVADDVLSMLRYWHEQAKQGTIWRKLRFIVVQSTEVYTSADFQQSPFDVGLALTLSAFTLEQMQDLALRYGLLWALEIDSPQLISLYQLLGGHPYLTNLAFYHLRRGVLTLEQLLDTAAEPSGIYGQYLRDHLAIVQNEPALVLAMQQVLNSDIGVRLETLKVAYQLESLGLIQLDGTLAKPSCELYRLYFKKHLADCSVPCA